MNDPFGRAIDVVSQTPEREGHNVFLDDRPHDPGERGADPAPDGAPVGREERDRDRARPAHGRRARDGECSRATTRTGSRACPPGCRRTTPCSTCTSPARPSSSSRWRGCCRTGSCTPSTAFTLPYSIRVADRTVHDAEKRGTERLTVAQILSHSSNVGAVTLAEKLGKPSGSRRGSPSSVSAARPGSTSPARARGSCSRVEQWSGSTIGNVPIGQGIARDADPDGVRLRCDGEPRRLGAAAPRRPRFGRGPSEGEAAAPRHAAASSGELKTMLEDVVSEGTGTLAADSRLHGRRQDGHRAEARRQGRLLLVASTWPRSWAWFPRRSRGSSILVMVDEPRRGDLGRSRRGSGVLADRAVRHAVPRGAARRADYGEVGVTARTHPKPPPTHGGRECRGEMRTCLCRESVDSARRRGSLVGESG